MFRCLFAQATLRRLLQLFNSHFVCVVLLSRIVTIVLVFHLMTCLVICLVWPDLHLGLLILIRLTILFCLIILRSQGVLTLFVISKCTLLLVIGWIIIRSLCSYKETSSRVGGSMRVHRLQVMLPKMPLVVISHCGIICVTDFMSYFSIRAPRFMESTRRVHPTSRLASRLV